MKRKWLSRVSATMLAGVMTTGMLAGCGDTQNDVSSEKETKTTETNTVETEVTSTESARESEEITYPLTSGMSLSWFVRNNLDLLNDYLTYEESPFHSGLSEMTGVDIEWQFFAQGADKTAAFNLLLQEEELPNIISGYFSSDETSQMLEDGLIYDLADYLPVYAPDYWEFISAPENAPILRETSADSGEIFGVAAVRESAFNVTYRGPVIRQDWLDECGLQEPVTLEDWEKVLVVFKEKYGAKLGFAMNRFSGGGISSGTGAFAVLSANYYIDENGKVQSANVQAEWKEMLETMHRWYEMGLIDKDFATTKDADVRAKVLNNEIGVSFTAMSQLTNWIADAEAENTGAKWVGFEYARTAPGEPTNFIDITYSLGNVNNAALVTTSSTEEELIEALKLLNYGFTEEGILYWNYGKEGVSYTLDANGEPQWTDLVKNDEGGLERGAKRYAGAYNAPISIQLESYVKSTKSEVANEAVYKWINNTEAQKYVLPSTGKTADELSVYNDIKATINTYVEEMALKFVTGDESLDNFDAFVKELDNKGLQDLLTIEQAAYERFMAR